ncbi:hypothetical protein [Coprococcus sp. AF21-14LB]|uniref:hypothetical protein n=1 Tax=Coprococcus sp. AF21-14LB TaxID=2292231 RepID=UPI0026961C58|nr:hypothetical protein [Coprococcus sp. AF21-14LB]
MSQEKVDKYKQEKANRKQIMQKEKRMKVVRKCLYSVIGIALIGWLGYSAYDNYQANQREKLQKWTTVHSRII